MNLDTNGIVVASKRYSLIARDFVQGLLMAVYGAIGAPLLAMITAWAMQVDYKFDRDSLILMGKGAGLAAGTYIVKKFFQKERIVIVDPPRSAIKAAKEGQPIRAMDLLKKDQIDKEIQKTN